MNTALVNFFFFVHKFLYLFLSNLQTHLLNSKKTKFFGKKQQQKKRTNKNKQGKNS